MQLKTVNKKIAHLNMELVNGKGYFYFIYDDGGPGYDTFSEYVCYLNSYSLERWVSIAEEIHRKILLKQV